MVKPMLLFLLPQDSFLFQCGVQREKKKNGGKKGLWRNTWSQGGDYLSGLTDTAKHFHFFDLCSSSTCSQTFHDAQTHHKDVAPVQMEQRFKDAGYSSCF